MKQNELLKKAKCTVCGKGVGHTGLPLFWTMKLERHGIKLDAINRQAGLGMMLGSHVLAAVMGPNEDMTEVLAEAEIILCENCAMSPQIPMVLFERADHESEKDESEN